MENITVLPTGAIITPLFWVNYSDWALESWFGFGESSLATQVLRDLHMDPQYHYINGYERMIFIAMQFIMYNIIYRYTDNRYIISHRYIHIYPNYIPMTFPLYLNDMRISFSLAGRTVFQMAMPHVVPEPQRSHVYCMYFWYKTYLEYMVINHKAIIVCLLDIYIYTYIYTYKNFNILYTHNFQRMQAFAIHIEKMRFNAVDWGAVILNVKTRYADESNILFMDIHPPKTSWSQYVEMVPIFNSHPTHGIVLAMPSGCWGTR